MELITIRYHKNGTGIWSTTAPFDPEGTQTNYHRLAMLKDDRVIVGNPLLYELEQPVFPDVPFIELLPLVERPHGHYESRWEMVLQPEGFYIWQWVSYLIEDWSQEQYEAQVAEFKLALTTYLKIAHEYYFPIIPDTPDYTWELVDKTKPPRSGRYTPIPVEPGKYTGNKWFITYEHDALYDYYVNTYAHARTMDGNNIPLVAMIKNTIKIIS